MVWLRLRFLCLSFLYLKPKQSQILPDYLQNSLGYWQAKALRKLNLMEEFLKGFQSQKTSLNNLLQLIQPLDFSPFLSKKHENSQVSLVLPRKCIDIFASMKSNPSQVHFLVKTYFVYYKISDENPKVNQALYALNLQFLKPNPYCTLFCLQFMQVYSNLTTWIQIMREVPKF